MLNNILLYDYSQNTIQQLKFHAHSSLMYSMMVEVFNLFVFKITKSSYLKQWR